MKAIRWYAPRDMRLVDVDKPVPKAHEALIRIESVGVCGSDMHYYIDGHIGGNHIKEPLILGHEYAGIVESVGADADPTLVGQRVAVEPGIPCMKCEWCRRGNYNVCCDMFFPGGPPHDGALSEYYTVHAGFCFPVPETMSAPVAAMIEPLAVALHTVELAHAAPGETAAIIGLGPIGLLVAQVARECGLGPIYGADLRDYRVEVSPKHGVDAACNASDIDPIEFIMDATNGRGVDVAFDCTNASEGIAIAMDVARPAGRCVLTGISGKVDDTIPVGRARRKELTVTWCRRFKNNFPTAIAWALEGRIDVESLITHSFPLERTNDAFELVANYGDGVLKASIDR